MGNYFWGKKKDDYFDIITGSEKHLDEGISVGNNRGHRHRGHLGNKQSLLEINIERLQCIGKGRDD